MSLCELCTITRARAGRVETRPDSMSWRIVSEGSSISNLVSGLTGS